MRRVLQVFEHQALAIEDGGLTASAFDALVRFNQRHRDQFFAVRHRSLKFSHYVGVLQVGGLTIEVLPKADNREGGDKTRWRNALIDMLRSCHRLKLEASSRALLSVRRASLFDLYIGAFLAEVRALVRQGLVRKYRRVGGNIRVFKGQLLFGRHVTENLVHRERFFAAYERYDRNNIFNQILCVALRVVSSAVQSASLRGVASDLLVWMEDVEPGPVRAETFTRLRLDRSTERYEYALALAKMIILNFQPDVRAGGHDVLAILFDMNELFEEYVLRQLKGAAGPLGVEVYGQQSRMFWCASSVSRSIRPDILVRVPRGGNEEEVVVIDTKWKVPVGRCPEDTDLRQVYAYNLQFGAMRGFLIYPRTDTRDDIDGEFEAALGGDGTRHSCGMWFVELFEEARLRRDVGASVLGRIVDGGRPSHEPQRLRDVGRELRDAGWQAGPQH